MTGPTAAVIYAAKSTEDKHGWIPTQLDDARVLAEREGLEVVGQYSDEAASAFKGDRGPGLARALAHAESERCALIVQHSDRLARGDARQAKHLVEYALWAIKTGVTIRSVQDAQTFASDGLVYAALMGDRNTDDSKRKSASVRDGLRRRKERGAPVGPLPLGYTVEREVIDTAVITRRVVEPTTAQTVHRIFGLVEEGSTFGDVARALNADGVVGRRGKPWVSRTVRTIVHNDAYAGRKGYPLIIEPERYDRIVAGLRRLDPAAVQWRKGGRKPSDDSYVLRGVSFCRRCGGALYTRRQAVGRVYVCANRRQGTGLCHADPIPATLIEGHVLGHLDVFVGDVADWIAELLDRRSSDQAGHAATVDRERAALADLDRTREQLMAEYRRQVAAGHRTAHLALEEVERIDSERKTQRHVVEKAEAVASEWQGQLDVDGALDFYTELVALVRGKVNAATGAAELNAALSTVLVGMWAEVEDGRLVADFRLRVPDGDEPGIAGTGFHLSPVDDAQIERQRGYLEPGETETSTLV